MPRPLRNGRQLALDTVTFPIRAFTLIADDWRGLSSNATERFENVAKVARGHCLDVGCGPGNRYIREFHQDSGIGVDVYAYEGVEPERLLSDPTSWPFADSTFDCVTFIGNFNHVPSRMRDDELDEAHRVLRPQGRVVITMASPIVGGIGHKVVALHDRLLGTNHDLDHERGMDHEEAYYLLDSEIRRRLARAGFTDITKKRFWTQWGLNHLIYGVKRT